MLIRGGAYLIILRRRPFEKVLNGLRVNGGGGGVVGVFNHEFIKSLIIRDFGDVLKNPFRYVHRFLLHTLSLKKIPKIAMHDL